MCGIVGIVGQSPVNQQIYDALTVLQHRGQDAAGIMTCDEGELFMRKQNGLVRGAVVIAVFVMLAEFVELNKVEWWKRSHLLPYASELASWIQNFAETGMKAVVDVQTTRSGA